MINEYVKISEGNGLFSNKFNLSKWKDAWDVAISNLKNEFAKFEENQTWESYFHVGEAIQKTGTILNAIYHIPLFIDGCDEKDRQKQEEKSTRQYNKIMVKQKPSVENFLNKKAKSVDKNDKAKAMSELNYWKSFSEKSAIALEMENKIHMQENPFVVPHLDMYDMGMANKYKNNAKNKGMKGFMIDGRDGNLSTIISWQKNEEVRKILWEKMQSLGPKDSDIQKSIKIKKDIANENGYKDFISYLDRYSPGMKLKTISQRAKKEVRALSSHYKKMMREIYDSGLKVCKIDGDINEPWNESYIIDNGWRTNTLDPFGNEFSLDRILNFIIPDLLMIGGWEVESIEKIGKNKRCLYLYSIFKNNEKAYFYFAPHPHANYKESNHEAAYASVIREKWNNGKEKIPAIVLVAQNFTLNNGFLADFNELAYLSHEMGHVLHFLSMKGDKFDEFNRMANGLSELPSLILEQLASDAKTLARWSDAENKYCQSVKYWQRRVGENQYDLYEYIQFLEGVWMDNIFHQKYDEDIKKIVKQFKKDVNLPLLHEKDRKVQCEFNFTGLSGYNATYFAGRALSRKLIGELSKENIQLSLNKLIDNVLIHTSDETERAWRKTYGRGMKDMFDEGVDMIRQDYNIG